MTLNTFHFAGKFTHPLNIANLSMIALSLQDTVQLMSH